MRSLVGSLTLGLLLSVGALANPVSLSFSNEPGASVTFTPGSTVTFEFAQPDPTGYDFVITGGTGFPDPVLPLKGFIDGTFSFLASDITTSGGVQNAPVTSVGGLLRIDDGTGQFFTAVLDIVSISTFQTGTVLNGSAVVNLSNFSYAGTDANLLYLTNFPAGILTASLTFLPSQTLTTIANGTDPLSTLSYSGTLSAVPEPTFYGLLSAGVAGLIFFARRRKVEAANN